MEGGILILPYGWFPKLVGRKGAIGSWMLGEGRVRRMGEGCCVGGRNGWDG